MIYFILLQYHFLPNQWPKLIPIVFFGQTVLYVYYTHFMYVFRGREHYRPTPPPPKMET